MIHQQTLIPRKNADQLQFLHELADLIKTNPAKALEVCAARHAALLAESEPRLVAFDPHAERNAWARQQEVA